MMVVCYIEEVSVKHGECVRWTMCEIGDIIFLFKSKAKR